MPLGSIPSTTKKKKEGGKEGKKEGRKEGRKEDGLTKLLRLFSNL